MASTTALAKQLADSLYLPDFADLFVLEATMTEIEAANDLDDPSVIAALATCSDLGPVQKRLVVRKPQALVDGLARATKLRATAKVCATTLLEAARAEVAAGAVAKRKGRPAFAVPERLPPLIRGKDRLSVADTDAVIAQLATTDADAFTPASRVAFGRALVFGWIAHGCDPKAKWVALGAAPFLDDAAAQDIAAFAQAIASRVGQFSKALVLVDTIAAMSTRGALAALDHLANHVTARAVSDRAKTALQDAAKRMDMKQHDLADRLMPAKAAPIDAGAFLRRLELRMLSGETISMRELVESILSNPVARELATGVVFATGKTSFVIAGGIL